jgi:hypothetical protein
MILVVGMENTNLPACFLAVLSAAWFALMAHKFHKGVVLWGISGAVLGMCIGSICIGLAHAATLPYTPAEIRHMQWVGITWAVILIGVTGAIIAITNRRAASMPATGKPSVSGKPSFSL